MATSSIFARLAGALFGAQRGDPAADIDTELLDDAVDAIVEAVEPRIRLVPRYRTKIAPIATRAIRFMRTLAPLLPLPIGLSRAAWSSDAYVGAFFATGSDIDTLLSRDAALDAFFADPANVSHDAAHAVLVMRREERNVLASAIVDGELRGDVAQTTIGFASHRLFAVTADADATRRAVGQAILERLAALALERIVATRERASELDVRKSMLAARLRMLTLRRDSQKALAAAGESDASAEIASLQQQLKATAADHLETKASLATLDYSIEQIEAVLGEPQQHLGIDTFDVRVSHTGYKLDAASSEPGSQLHLSELWIGAKLRAVIAPVYVPRFALARP